MRKQTILAFFVVASVGGCGTLLGLDDYTDSSSLSPVCAPNETRDCAYNGPETALAHNPCKRATQVCNAEGSGFSACAGEVLPAEKEDCSNQLDDDCNGMVNEGCSCVAGSMEACYTGPAGTEANLPCKAGTHTCEADGSGWGACTDEVLPGIEVCGNVTDTVDEDCSGAYCTEALWSNSYGDSDSQSAAAMAVDAAGNIIIAGSFEGGFDMGGVMLSSLGSADVFVAKLTQDGTVLWAKQFGFANNQRASDVAVDAAGNIIVVGDFLGSISFDNGMTTLTATSAQTFDNDIFVAKLDTNGDHVWSKRFGDDNDQSVRGLAIDGSGNVILTGTYKGSMNFNPGTILAASGTGNYDAFVAKLNSNGGGVWAKTYGDAPQYQGGIDVVADGPGSITFIATLRGTINFGPAAYTGSTSGDYVIARLDPTGTHVWSRWASGGGEPVSAAAIARDSGGSILVGGTFNGTIDFLPGVMSSDKLTNPGMGANIFVAKYAAADGAVTWATQVGAMSSSSGQGKAVYGIATDTKDNVFIMGGCKGVFDLGLTDIQCSIESYTPFLGKLSFAGAPVWGRGYGLDSGSIYDAAYVNPAKLFVLGYNTKWMNLGNGIMPSKGQGDIAVGLIVPE
ncbi:MAG: hypothetical protein IPM54_25670 [Polyangiaceae bacterium]|nr:hypothetical protein [Polyangiaceae bacterium]